VAWLRPLVALPRFFGAYGLCNRPLSGFCRASSSTPMRMSKAASSPLVTAAVILSLLAQACAAPALTRSSSANAAHTGGLPVTISGLAFDSNDQTPSVSLELSVQCSSTSWTSATTVYCAAASYRGGTRRTTATIAGLVGSSTGLFTFDGTGACAAVRRGTCSGRIACSVCAAPAVSSISPANAAQTGGVDVSISGLNFASTDPSPSASLELSAECSSTSWTTATTVYCAAASYRGGTRRTTATIAGLVGSSTGLFTFDGTGACAAARRWTCSTMIAARCAQLRP
jgi:hypothetical protein